MSLSSRSRTVQACCQQNSTIVVRVDLINSKKKVPLLLESIKRTLILAISADKLLTARVLFENLKGHHLERSMNLVLAPS